MPLIRDSWPFPAPHFLLLCVRTDHIPAGTKLNSPPPFPFFESGNLWQQWEFVLSFLLTSEVYCKGRKVILCTWILFSSPLQHLLPHKGDRGFHSQVFKDDKWWMLGAQVWKSGCLPLLSPGVLYYRRQDGKRGTTGLNAGNAPNRALVWMMLRGSYSPPHPRFVLGSLQKTLESTNQTAAWWGSGQRERGVRWACP